MCEFCQMTWTFQNLILSQKYLILDLQKGQIKSASSKENFKWENYFIGIMFLHQFDILNRNLNGFFQKVLPHCDEIMRRDEIRWFDGTELLIGCGKFVTELPIGCCDQAARPGHQALSLRRWASLLLSFSLVAESLLLSSTLVVATSRPGLGIRRYLSEGEQVCF